MKKGKENRIIIKRYTGRVTCEEVVYGLLKIVVENKYADKI